MTLDRSERTAIGSTRPLSSFCGLDHQRHQGQRSVLLAGPHFKHRLKQLRAYRLADNQPVHAALGAGARPTARLSRRFSASRTPWSFTLMMTVVILKLSVPCGVNLSAVRVAAPAAKQRERGETESPHLGTAPTFDFNGEGVHNALPWSLSFCGKNLAAIRRPDGQYGGVTYTRIGRSAND